MTDVIYLAPLCQEHERMWCEHDAPVDCKCIDGPHPWIKYVAAPKQPTQSDALREENERLREAVEKERAAIVAWLRKLSGYDATTPIFQDRRLVYQLAALEFSSAIEAGEHLK